MQGLAPWVKSGRLGVGCWRVKRIRRLLLSLLAAAWLVDYIRSVRRVRLVFGKGRQAALRDVEARAHVRLANIVKRCPALSSLYWPTWYAPQALLQLLLVGFKELRARLLQRSPYKRQMCTLRDSTQIALDWVLPEADLASKMLPVCVLLHGAFMDSASVTMSDLARDLAARGLPAVVMNRRGYGGVAGSDGSLRVTMFGFDEDLDDVLASVGRQQPGRIVAIIGFSCGAGFAGRYAGNRGLQSAWPRQSQAEETSDAKEGHTGDGPLPRLLCVVGYDPGYDVSPDGAISRIKPPFSWVVNCAMKYYYAFRHRKALRKESSEFYQVVGEMLSPKSGTVKTYRLTRKLSGVDDSSAWLEMQQPRLGHIALPCMLINSRDDPICVWSNVEAHLPEIKSNPHVVLADLERGSHGCKFDFWGTCNVAHGMIAEFVTAASEELHAPLPDRA